MMEPSSWACPSSLVSCILCLLHSLMMEEKARAINNPNPNYHMISLWDHVLAHGSFMYKNVRYQLRKWILGGILSIMRHFLSAAEPPWDHQKRRIPMYGTSPWAGLMVRVPLRGSIDAMQGLCATCKDILVDVDWPTTYFIIRYTHGPWAHSALLLEQTQRKIIQGTFFKQFALYFSSNVKFHRSWRPQQCNRRRLQKILWRQLLLKLLFKKVRSDRLHSWRRDLLPLTILVHPLLHNRRPSPLLLKN